MMKRTSQNNSEVIGFMGTSCRGFVRDVTETCPPAEGLLPFSFH
jgi:hypothetical protein